MMWSIYICLLTISIGEVFLKVFDLFLVKLFSLLMNFKSISYIAFWKNSFIMCLLQIFSYLVCFLSSHSLDIFPRAQVFNFNEDFVVLLCSYMSDSLPQHVL